MQPSPPSPSLPSSPYYQYEDSAYPQYQLSTTPPQLYPAKHIDPLIGDGEYNLRRAKRLSNLSLIFYLSAVFLYITDIASIIITFHLVYRTGLISRRKYPIVGFAFAEFIMWICVPLFSWYTTERCEDDEGLVECGSHWDGWPVLVAWYCVLMVCGVPRVIMTHVETRRQVF